MRHQLTCCSVSLLILSCNATTFGTLCDSDAACLDDRLECVESICKEKEFGEDDADTTNNDEPRCPIGTVGCSCTNETLICGAGLICDATKICIDPTTSTSTSTSVALGESTADEIAGTESESSVDDTNESATDDTDSPNDVNTGSKRDDPNADVDGDIRPLRGYPGVDERN